MASCSGASREYTLTLTVNQGTQSIPENFTEVSWSLKFTCGQYYYQNGSSVDNFQAWIDGACVYNKNLAISFPGKYKEIAIASGTHKIYHNGDGTKSAGFSCSFSPGRSASYYPGAINADENIGLSTIPRATNPSVNNDSPILGTTITINTPRASASFTHKLEWWCGSLNGTISTSVATSVNWVVPLTIATQYPNAVNGAVGIRCHTYSGSTLLGSTEIYITGKIPDNMVPSFSSIGVTRVDNGVPVAWGIYVKGISKITLNIVGAVGSNGSTIKSYSIVGGGFSSDKNVATLGPFSTAETIKFTCTITDSRGRTASKTTSIAVIDYYPPALTLKAERCNSSGTALATGQYVKIIPVYSIAPVSSKNAITSRKFEIVGTTYNNTTCASGGSVVLGGNTLAQNKEYTIKGTIADTLGNKAEITTNISISAVPFNIKANKLGVGIGRYCNRDGEFQIGYKMYLANPIIVINDGAKDVQIDLRKLLLKD